MNEDDAEVIRYVVASTGKKRASTSNRLSVPSRRELRTDHASDTSNLRQSKQSDNSTQQVHVIDIKMFMGNVQSRHAPYHTQLPRC